MQLSSAVRWDERLSNEQISYYAGCLVHSLPFETVLPSEKHARLTSMYDIKINAIPRVPIIKMTKRQYAEEMVSNGKFRVGSIDYFQHFEHDQIGDASEGKSIAIGVSESVTVMKDMRTGLNDWILCCFAGAADAGVLAEFGYDCAVRITDPIAFGTAIQAAIGAEASYFARCVYCREKVLIGPVKETSRSPFYLESDAMLGVAKAFLKPLAYAPQRELRFIWPTKAECLGNLDITAPDAAKYCEIV